MDPAPDAILADLERLSETLAPEARYYWARHRPRYRFLLQTLLRLNPARSFARILDVGMGYEAVALQKQYPESQVDGLGIGEDHRYKPSGDYSFHSLDLNDAAALDAAGTLTPGGYDLIVCMEVIEHLYNPPERVLQFLARQLAVGGVLFVTTPNAAWLKNRLKMMVGRNPFELLSGDRAHLGHIREYTLAELQRAFAVSGLHEILSTRRGLYHFNNRKDRVYSWLADHTHDSLSRTLVAVYRRANR
jgi:2-polyprenyl-3-methyl-5-hydroxy-6-metoxy-1,4-benzoquinol methylase